MPTLVLNCPHCGTARGGFKFENEFAVPQRPYSYAVSASCNACGMPICALLDPAIRDGRKPSAYNGNLMDGASFNVFSVYPSPRPDDTPDEVPDVVAKPFRQGSASKLAGHFDAACSMYRKTMELALKNFSPDIEAWKIEKRIDKMASENRITPELQAWAHELRLDGNEALHGDGEATAEMADQMHELCKFLLLYLYTLPAQVAAATARRNE